MIRKGKVEDVRSIAEFMQRFPSEFVDVDVECTVKTYERLVEQGNTTLLILEDNGQMQGGLGFILSPDLYNGKITAVETYWFVAPEFRGKGMELFEAFEHEAEKQGAEKLAMIHMEDSYPDILKRVYLSRGYSLIEQHYVKEL